MMTSKDDTYLFNGEICRVRSYDRALSFEEVERICREDRREMEQEIEQQRDAYLSRAMRAEALLVALLENPKVLYAIEDDAVWKAVEEWRAGRR
jgi:hypothetical protein